MFALRTCWISHCVKDMGCKNQDQTTFSKVGEYLHADYSLSIEILRLLLFPVSVKLRNYIWDGCRTASYKLDWIGCLWALVGVEHLTVVMIGNRYQVGISRILLTGGKVIETALWFTFQPLVVFRYFLAIIFGGYLVCVLLWLAG